MWVSANKRLCWKFTFQFPAVVTVCRGFWSETHFDEKTSDSLCEFSGFIVRQTQLESLPTSRLEDLPLVQQKKGSKCRRPRHQLHREFYPPRAHVTNRQQPGLTPGNRCDIVTTRSSFTMEIPSISSINSLRDKDQGTEVHAKMCSQVVFAVLSLFSLKSCLCVLKRGG